MIKLLIVVPSYPKTSGVDYHRLLMPHQVMSDLFKDEIEISLINEIDSATDDFLKDFHLVVLNRFLSKTNEPELLIEKLKRVGLPYVMDLDDDYILPKNHILYQVAYDGNHTKQISLAVKNATACTTTHEILGNTLNKELGQKNIYIVPNGIYPDGHFSLKEVPKTSRLNFGWSGSITHLEDVILMHDALYSLYTSEDYKDKFRVVYGGFATQSETSQAILGVLSARGKATESQFGIFRETGVTEYGNFYDLIDVSLIPLRNNRFNNNKSNLKLLESGFKMKAVICSDVYPYSPDLKHGVNCLKVKHKNDWYKHMTKLIDNPNLVEDLRSQLYIDVQRYHMANVVTERFNAYKDILCLNY